MTIFIIKVIAAVALLFIIVAAEIVVAIGIDKIVVRLSGGSGTKRHDE
jgi:hypothetical protein